MPRVVEGEDLNQFFVNPLDHRSIYIPTGKLSYFFDVVGGVKMRHWSEVD